MTGDEWKILVVGGGEVTVLLAGYVDRPVEELETLSLAIFFLTPLSHIYTYITSTLSNLNLNLCQLVSQAQV